MRKRRTKRYDLPRIDLNRVKLPKVNLPKIDVSSPKVKLPKIEIPWKQLVVIVGMAVLAVTMFNLNTRLSEYTRLSHERDTLGTQVGDLRATKMVLETREAYVESTQAAIDAGREEKMVREGEKLIVVLTPANYQAAATPQTDVEDVKPPEPWEVWMALFFGQ